MPEGRKGWLEEKGCRLELTHPYGTALRPRIFPKLHLPALLSISSSLRAVPCIFISNYVFKDTSRYQ